MIRKLFGEGPETQGGSAFREGSEDGRSVPGARTSCPMGRQSLSCSVLVPNKPLALPREQSLQTQTKQHQSF